MSVETIREKVKDMFEENGLVIFPGEEDASLDLDSLRLISLVVAVENTFEIEVPEQYLSQAMLSSYNDFCDLVVMLCR